MVFNTHIDFVNSVNCTKHSCRCFNSGCNCTFSCNDNTLFFSFLLNNVRIAIHCVNNGLAAINLKCDPEYAIKLREAHESIEPGWHMNKKHWNTLYIHKNDLSPKLIYELIDHSYDMVLKGMTNKMRSELE